MIWFSCASECGLRVFVLSGCWKPKNCVCGGVLILGRNVLWLLFKNGDWLKGDEGKVGSPFLYPSDDNIMSAQVPLICLIMLIPMWKYINFLGFPRKYILIEYLFVLDNEFNRHSRKDRNIKFPFPSELPRLKLQYGILLENNPRKEIKL